MKAIAGKKSADRGTAGGSLEEQTLAYLFLAPWLVGFLALTVGPMISSLYLSFTEYDLLTPAKWIGADNYVRMFTDDPRYFTALKVTFIFVLLAVPLKLAFSLLVAVLLNQGLRGLPVYRAVYYIPTLLGGSVAVSVLWKKIFSAGGIVNEFLFAAFGYKGPDWVSNPKYALYSLILLSAWQFGSSMVIFLAGLKQIPTDYYEASAVDGATKATQFFRITLPLLTPVVFFNLVIQMIGSFQSFTSAFIVSGGSGGPIDSTLFYTLYLYQKGFANFEMGYASAMAWALLAIIAAFTAILFRSSGAWVHYEDGGKS